VVRMVEWASVKRHHSSESVQVVNSGHSGDLGSKAVASNSGHCNLFLVHEADNVVAHFVKAERLVVVRFAEVSVIYQPHVSVVKNFVLRLQEEGLEVCYRLAEVSKPEKGGKILGATLEEVSSQIHILGVLLVLTFGRNVTLGKSEELSGVKQGGGPLLHLQHLNYN